MVSPGDSSVPANRLPIITQDAPAASALEMSPEYLIPPSAMSGTSVPCAARAASMIAVNCGTPAPVTTRVVQIDPGPMPTFKPSTPREINSFVPSYVATFPAMRDRKSTRLNSSHGYISYAVFCLKKKKLIDSLARCLHRTIQPASTLHDANSAAEFPNTRLRNVYRSCAYRCIREPSGFKSPVAS